MTECSQAPARSIFQSYHPHNRRRRRVSNAGPVLLVDAGAGDYDFAASHGGDKNPPKISYDIAIHRPGSNTKSRAQRGNSRVPHTEGRAPSGLKGTALPRWLLHSLVLSPHLPPTPSPHTHGQGHPSAITPPTLTPTHRLSFCREPSAANLPGSL